MSQISNIQFTFEYCFQEFANDGLRTLCLASKDISESYWNTWKAKHHEARYYQSTALSLCNVCQYGAVFMPFLQWFFILVPFSRSFSFWCLFRGYFHFGAFLTVVFILMPFIKSFFILVTFSVMYIYCQFLSCFSFVQLFSFWDLLCNSFISKPE